MGQVLQNRLFGSGTTAALGAILKPCKTHRILDLVAVRSMLPHIVPTWFQRKQSARKDILLALRLRLRPNRTKGMSKSLSL